MPSHATDSMIFRDFFGTAEMRAVFDDHTLVQFWLDVEAALARVQARLGIIPEDAASEIDRQADVEMVDFDKLHEETNLVGYPILPLVRQLAAACTGEAGNYVHWGATTQDIMDTANVLQLREALHVIERDLESLIDILVRLAQKYRDTPMAGRTHGQHALPITFGFKLAVWIDELRRHAERIAHCKPRLLRCQFAGAVGTLASLDDHGQAVHDALAEELHLAPAPIPWHSARDSFAEFINLCGLISATLGKVAHEIASMQKTEVNEVREPFVEGKGSSSTMPQKENPILCETVIGIARLVIQQVPAMLSAALVEHERAMGEWHVEWDLIPHVCLLTGAALHHSIAIFDGLTVNASAMRKNLDLTHGTILAEAVMMRLARRIGRQRAHDLVYDISLSASQGDESFGSALRSNEEVVSVLSDQEIERLLTPNNYIGRARQIVDHVTQVRRSRD